MLDGVPDDLQAELVDIETRMAAKHFEPCHTQPRCEEAL
jgi:hypothetical protein